MFPTWIPTDCPLWNHGEFGANTARMATMNAGPYMFDGKVFGLNIMPGDCIGHGGHYNFLNQTCKVVIDKDLCARYYGLWGDVGEDTCTMSIDQLQRGVVAAGAPLTEQLNARGDPMLVARKEKGPDWLLIWMAVGFILLVIAAAIATYFIEQRNLRRRAARLAAQEQQLQTLDSTRTASTRATEDREKGNTRT
ncbi:unnamed protein product [Periconia digitata]|uniref:Uncharacterized protein n=1 Tax=Periconia digitata TaxID=1303443 RepID=A0A9W4UK17_9PLEO|nr:unnamed protein product [Periconia digitata]